MYLLKQILLLFYYLAKFTYKEINIELLTAMTL